MHELTNGVVDVEVVLGANGRVLGDRYSDCMVDQRRVAVLDTSCFGY